VFVVSHVRRSWAVILLLQSDASFEPVAVVVKPVGHGGHVVVPGAESPEAEKVPIGHGTPTVRQLLFVCVFNT
jgi:hypothetical protein